MIAGIWLLTKMPENPQLWILSMLAVLGSIMFTTSASKHDKKYRTLKYIRKTKEHMGADYKVTKPPTTLFQGETRYGDNWDYNEFDHE